MLKGEKEFPHCKTVWVIWGSWQCYLKLNGRYDCNLEKTMKFGFC